LRAGGDPKIDAMSLVANLTDLNQLVADFRIRFALAALLSLFLPNLLFGAAGTASPVGFWKNDDATFEIFADEGKLSGKIIAMREPRTPEGKEKTDVHNPDASKRDRPILGLVFMSGFTQKSDNHWDNGTIYDPKSGNTYSCFMDLDGPEKIKMRGFLGISLLGRTEVWTRASVPSPK
jgi:uncharacterized protein (DUF2147 family)